MGSPRPSLGKLVSVHGSHQYMVLYFIELPRHLVRVHACHIYVYDYVVVVLGKVNERLQRILLFAQVLATLSHIEVEGNVRYLLLQFLVLLTNIFQLRLMLIPS